MIFFFGIEHLLEIYYLRFSNFKPRRKPGKPSWSPTPLYFADVLLKWRASGRGVVRPGLRCIFPPFLEPFL